MSAEQDDLALELFISDNYKQPRETSIQDWLWLTTTGHARWSIEHYKTMAEHILTAGYRKPRIIETVDEMDGLPNGSVILDPAGLSLHKHEFTGWYASNGVYGISREMLGEAVPATVIHEPTA